MTPLKHRVSLQGTSSLYGSHSAAHPKVRFDQPDHPVYAHYLAAFMFAAYILSANIIFRLSQSSYDCFPAAAPNTLFTPKQIMLMLVEVGFIVAASLETFSNDTFEGLSSHTWMDAALFAVATSVDLILTGALLFILRSNQTRFQRTKTILDTLSLYAVIATGINTYLSLFLSRFIHNK
ncbi:hypothetical protein DICSQDRAFT_172330 [Dichomitus squalens LYAD-421 SS1]|uniref:Uncharacterized protein n=1 Tax=Dichomitus squalens (strain LYAD-421) TaxID=732165 RepID=R7SSP1_DICSQ|nr:uncharacterized protein DICSQDRAFT_172330 [Dichomitus squalens LYAD-421 SS1]EJF59184.1 hypothetical protein DICSQDRAFT_172330 [Dichomitus squalens LYAD-421 SS1]